MRDAAPRLQPRVQSPAARRRNFDEVVQGYTAEQAAAEARRCLLCRQARCQGACPLRNQISRWVAELQQGRVEAAYRIVRETSPMPELCSRLCPQERLCEGACALGIKHEPVAVGLLERFVCDQVRAAGSENGYQAPRPTPSCGVKRVAVVGSGPAGLALAQVLARAGHQVTVFERAPQIGGVLRWIPRFKLPIELLDAHVARLTRWGVSFAPNTEVDETASWLADGRVDAVFLGLGAGRPSAPSIPGGSLGGVVSSTEFLVRACAEDSFPGPARWTPIGDLTGQQVVVLGGGDSAMDCVRTAIRLGAAGATCIYRRDEANMPGSKKEVRAAKEEGTRFQFLASPTAFRTRDGRRVSSIECVRMALGPPDASGRRAPTRVPGSGFLVDADWVVLAFGYEVEGGTRTVNPATGATPRRGVFAGGDCVTGPGLVCTAARAGVIAAHGMLRYFAGEPWDALA